MRRYQKDLGIPFVYVTHNQEEALTMSDRMAVMHRGALEQVGPKLDVYNAPATRFVASFVGAPNKLAGRVVDDEGERLRIDWDGLTLIGRSASGARRGDFVEIYLESERIALDPAAHDVQNDNRIDGTVRDIIFKGQFRGLLRAHRQRGGAGRERAAQPPRSRARLARDPGLVRRCGRRVRGRGHRAVTAETTLHLAMRVRSVAPQASWSGERPARRGFKCRSPTNMRRIGRATECFAPVADVP